MHFGAKLEVAARSGEVEGKGMALFRVNELAIAISCPYCAEPFCAPSEELLMANILLVHTTDPNFLIKCSLHGCETTFPNFRISDVATLGKRAFFTYDLLSWIYSLGHL